MFINQSSAMSEVFLAILIKNFSYVQMLAVVASICSSYIIA